MIDSSRNRWLRKATTLLRPLLTNGGHPCAPQTLVVRVGSPRPDEVEWDGLFYEATPVYPAHIVLSRSLVDSHHVLRVLLHELCHFATESECQAHGNAFRNAARAIGLRSKHNEPTAWTTPTPSLHRALERILHKLGPYPQEK